MTMEDFLSLKPWRRRTLSLSLSLTLSIPSLSSLDLETCDDIVLL